MTEYSYQVGGSLAFNHPTYIQRKADLELLYYLKQRQFCYVFNCRQMGKSSLRVRTIHQLQAEGKICLSLDITSLGSDITKDQWYCGFITQLFLGLNLLGQVNLKKWFKERQDLPPVQKLRQFIEDILLKSNLSSEYFIFIDEIDKVLSLNFSLDDFFSWIRFCYNQRAECPEYQRLTFTLFGVATPTDLIHAKTETPFNIGQAIELTGFTASEILPLASGLTEKSSSTQVVLEEILYWTGGQPFLTQKICQLILQTEGKIETGQEREYLKKLVENQIIKHWESQDEPIHLRTIRDRLFYWQQKISGLLGLYQNILQQGGLEAENTAEESELRLSGLVVKQDNQLRVYNQIYQAVFNLTWLKQELTKLRPYGEAIQAWSSDKSQDTSRLLRGKALEDALFWAQGKTLSGLDYEFLAASQKLASQEAERELAVKQHAINILEKATSQAQQRITLGLGVSISLILGSLIFSGLAWKRQQEAWQGNQLQIAGERAWQQFQYNQIQGLKAAIKSGQELYQIVQDNRPLQEYPATSPLFSLQKILTRLRDKHEIIGYQDKVNSLSFSRDGHYLATASSDGQVKLLDRNNQTIQTIIKQNDLIYSLNISPQGDRIATANQDGIAQIWTIKGKLLATLKGHQDSINSINFNYSGDLIVTASADNTARIWNRKGQVTHILLGHSKSVSAAVFDPKNLEIATASRDGTVKRWTIQGGKKATWSVGIPINDVNYSPDGQSLAVALKDGTYRLRNLQTGKEITVKAHQNALTSINYSPDGRHIVTTSRDGTVKLWTIQGGILLTLKGHQESVNDAKFSPKGEEIATASSDKTVKIWSLSQSKSLLTSTETVTSVSFNRLKQLIAFSSSAGKVYILDKQGKLKKQWQAHPDWIYSLDWSGDGKYLVTASISGVVNIWDINKKLFTLKDFAQTYSVKFSPDSKLLAIAYQTPRQSMTQVGIWQMQKNTPPQKVSAFPAHLNPIYNLSFSPTGQKIATASQDEQTEEGIAKIWDLQGKLKYTIRGGKKLLYQVQFSPDTKHILTASRDGQVKLWGDNGQTSVNLNLEEDFLPVYSVNFSPDGQSILSGAEDGTIRLWDSQGNLKAEFNDSSEAIYGVAFRDFNRDVITLSRNGHLKIWSLGSSGELKDLLSKACQWIINYPLGEKVSSPCLKK